MSRTRICFLEGLPTITSIVEGFGGVPSNWVCGLHISHVLVASPVVHPYCNNLTFTGKGYITQIVE